MGREHEHFTPGRSPWVVPWRGFNVCPQVCYDLRFPVFSRRRSGLDYDLLIYVANWPAPRAAAWRQLLRARAIENLAYVVGVNRVGPDGHAVPHSGDSAAIDFLGQALVDRGDSPAVATVTLEAAPLQAFRTKFPAHLDADRFDARAMKKRTRVNHPPPVTLAEDNRPLVAPIYQTVKFEFDSLDETERYLRGERPGFFYTRSSNPTTRQLELLLAELQGRDDCLVTASGAGAIAQTLLGLTKQGDHIVCFVETYNPTRYLIRRLLGRFGVTHTLLSIDELEGVERVLSSPADAAGVLREPDQSRHQDRRHRQP